MTKQVRQAGIMTAVLTAVFLLFMILVKFVDVQPIGPMNTTVGFATVNGFFQKLIGTNDIFYLISKLCGAICILTAVLFAGIGGMQLYERKSLMKVDKNILAMGFIFLLVIIFYVLFDKIVINYRPVLEDGALEASFPSTHTMLACTIMGCALIECREVVTRKTTLKYIEIFCWVMIGLTIVTRFLSGVHWLTDIIGGILLSAALVSLYYTAVLYFRPKKKKKAAQKTASAVNAN